LAGVRMSHWVEACNWSGGRSSSSRPMSCTISASAPASYICQAMRRASSSSSSRRIVLRVMKTLAWKRCAKAARRSMSATGIAGAVARAEGGAADIHGIGAVLDRLDADLGIAGGGEQFEA
jgi:hypothetical protein